MEYRYSFHRQGSGVWRSLRDGDFQEEDVWGFLKESTDSSSNISQLKEPSMSIPRHLPTAARMIPRATSGGLNSRNSSNEANVIQQSAPVNVPVKIPGWSKIYEKKSKKTSKYAANLNDDADDDDDDNGFASDDENTDECEDDDHEEEEEEYNCKEPPHEFLARRLARSQISTFSVFEGVGRTLKGRDLSKVRNAVLIKTGFLESL